MLFYIICILCLSLYILKTVRNMERKGGTGGGEEEPGKKQISTLLPCFLNYRVLIQGGGCIFEGSSQKQHSRGSWVKSKGRGLTIPCPLHNLGAVIVLNGIELGVSRERKSSFSFKPVWINATLKSQRKPEGGKENPRPFSLGFSPSCCELWTLQSKAFFLNLPLLDTASIIWSTLVVN